MSHHDPRLGQQDSEPSRKPDSSSEGGQYLSPTEFGMILQKAEFPEARLILLGYVTMEYAALALATVPKEECQAVIQSISVPSLREKITLKLKQDRL
jgi:hypothetical protein